MRHSEEYQLAWHNLARNIFYQICNSIKGQLGAPIGNKNYVQTLFTRFNVLILISKADNMNGVK
jgi:hypothetical protein